MLIALPLTLMGRWGNKNAYEGSFVAGVYDGFGTFTWQDRAMYNGHWKGGKRHGPGIYTSADGAHVYDGEWNNDLEHGQGFQQLPDGRTFEGTFEFGLPGSGVLTLQGAAVHDSTSMADSSHVRWLARSRCPARTRACRCRTATRTRAQPARAFRRAARRCATRRAAQVHARAAPRRAERRAAPAPPGSGHTAQPPPPPTPLRQAGCACKPTTAGPSD